MAQLQANESISRRRSASSNGSASSYLTTNNVIRNMKVDITKAESKLTELSQHIGVNPPQHQSSKVELDKLKVLLSHDNKNVRSSVADTANVYTHREAELKAALVAQNAHVLELNLSQDELAVLQRDVENAQRGMDDASQRFTQATLEGKANQSEVAVLNPSIAPLIPTSSKVMRNILQTYCVGTILCVCFALLVELMNHHARSRFDVNELLELPIFTISGGTSQSGSKNLLASPRLLLKAN